MLRKPFHPSKGDRETSCPSTRRATNMMQQMPCCSCRHCLQVRVSLLPKRKHFDESIANEKDELQQELDSMTTTTTSQGFGFNPNKFDQSALPVPLFTGLVIMGFSLYMTGYFLYVGLYGFPANDTFPRPF